MEKIDFHISAPDAPQQGKTAMYIGSFDPFTLGHLNIVDQTLSVKTRSENTTTGVIKEFYTYDKLIICVGNNEDKIPHWEANKRKHFIELAIKDHPRAKDISVIVDSGLTVDIAHRHGVTTLIRGIRQGTTDEYNESQLAHINYELARMRGFHLSTQLLAVNTPFLREISSSLVRKLHAMHELTIMATCLPKPVAEEIIAETLYGYFIPLLGPYVNAYPYWLKLKEAYIGRPYHSMIHLAQMLDQLSIYKKYCDKDKNYVKPNENLRLAIFLHDYVYDVSPKDTAPERNETNSATVVLEWDKLRLLNISISAITVYNLIKATAHNEQCDDLTNEEKLIADLDLSILGTTYNTYAKAIREEYAVYSDEEYKKGRLAFLSSLLEKKHIFHLNFFRNRFEKQARKNISQEIANLQNNS